MLRFRGRNQTINRARLQESPKGAGANEASRSNVAESFSQFLVRKWQIIIFGSWITIGITPDRPAECGRKQRVRPFRVMKDDAFADCPRGSCSRFLENGNILPEPASPSSTFRWPAGNDKRRDRAWAHTHREHSRADASASSDATENQRAASSLRRSVSRSGSGSLIDHDAFGPGGVRQRADDLTFTAVGLLPARGMTSVGLPHMTGVPPARRRLKSASPRACRRRR